MTTTSNISAKTHVFFSVLYLVQQISTDRSKGSQSLNKLIHTPPRARVRRPDSAPSPTQTGDHTRGLARALPAHERSRSRAARRAPHRGSPARRRPIGGTWHEIFANHRVREHAALAALGSRTDACPLGPRKKNGKAGGCRRPPLPGGQGTVAAKAMANRIYIKLTQAG